MPFYTSGNKSYWRWSMLSTITNRKFFSFLHLSVDNGRRYDVCRLKLLLIKITLLFFRNYLSWDYDTMYIKNIKSYTVINIICYDEIWNSLIEIVRFIKMKIRMITDTHEQIFICRKRGNFIRYNRFFFL